MKVYSQLYELFCSQTDKQTAIKTLPRQAVAEEISIDDCTYDGSATFR